MIKELIKLSNHLDAKGLRKEADYLDSILLKLSSDEEELLDSSDWVSETSVPHGKGRGLSHYEIDDERNFGYSDSEYIDSEFGGFEDGELSIKNPEDIEMEILESRDETLVMINDIKNAAIANLTNITRALTKGKFQDRASVDALWYAYVSSENIKSKMFPDDDLRDRSGLSTYRR